MGFIARLREDIANVRQHDPAARGTVEIGLKAARATTGAPLDVPPSIPPA